MDNWKHWYQNYLQNKKKNEIQAFQDGLKGFKKIEGIHFSNKYLLSINSNWSEFIFKSASTEINTSFTFNDKLIFEDEVLNLALVKSLKNLKQIYPYSEHLINILLFKKLNSNLTSKEIIKILREPPEDWFTICSSCEKENNEGWLTCAHCGISFEDSLTI